MGTEARGPCALPQGRPLAAVQGGGELQLESGSEHRPSLSPEHVPGWAQTVYGGRCWTFCHCRATGPVTASRQESAEATEPRFDHIPKPCVFEINNREGSERPPLGSLVFSSHLSLRLIGRGPPALRRAISCTPTPPGYMSTPPGITLHGDTGGPRASLADAQHAARKSRSFPGLFRNLPAGSLSRSRSSLPVSDGSRTRACGEGSLGPPLRTVR